MAQLDVQVWGSRGAEDRLPGTLDLEVRSPGEAGVGLMADLLSAKKEAARKEKQQLLDAQRQVALEARFGLLLPVLLVVLPSFPSPTFLVCGGIGFPNSVG